MPTTAMRALLALIVLFAIPAATAQTAGQTAESGGARLARYSVVADTTDDPRRIEIRLDSLAERVGGLFGPDGPIGARMRRFEIEMEDGTLRVQSDGDGVDPEMHDRMRSLQSDARRLAGDARRGDRDAERRLDDVLEELFEVRGEMRRARAQALRDRAAELSEQADDLDAEARRRDGDRRQLIDARKRELMDDSAGSDW